jgi:hypothetical protein
MKMIQTRNILSRGLTGEKCTKAVRYHYSENGKRVYTTDYFVTPVTTMDERQEIIWDAYHDAIPGIDKYFIEERKALNVGGYILICRTKYYTSKECFEEEVRRVRYK